MARTKAHDASAQARKTTLRAVGGQIQSNKNNMPGHAKLMTEDGDNGRYIRHALTAMDLPPIDISDPVQVEQRIREYFQYCEEQDCRPGFVALANWIGIDRTTLNSWKRGEYRGATHSHIIQKAVSLLEEIWEELMSEGRINPVVGIWMGKQFYQQSDRQELAIAQDHEMRPVPTMEEIAKNLPPPVHPYPDDDLLNIE